MRALKKTRIPKRVLPAPTISPEHIQKAVDNNWSIFSLSIDGRTRSPQEMSYSETGVLRPKHREELLDLVFGWREERNGSKEAKVAERPTIVCLCGSTCFYSTFQEANYQETMAGRIVLTVGHYPHTDKHGQDIKCTPEQKLTLDELHKRKIDLADEILVLNVNGYVGDSTRSEIEYARAAGKRVRWLEELKGEQ